MSSDWHDDDTKDERGEQGPLGEDGALGPAEEGEAADEQDLAALLMGLGDLGGAAEPSAAPPKPSRGWRLQTQPGEVSLEQESEHGVSSPDGADGGLTRGVGLATPLEDLDAPLPIDLDDPEGPTFEPPPAVAPPEVDGQPTDSGAWEVSFDARDHGLSSTTDDVAVDASEDEAQGWDEPSPEDSEDSEDPDSSRAEPLEGSPEEDEIADASEPEPRETLDPWRSPGGEAADGASDDEPEPTPPEPAEGFVPGPAVVESSEEGDEELPPVSFAPSPAPEDRPITGISLLDPAYYINRELSWLEFNGRVLAQALDEDTPALERLKFLCISSTNLDEFFEVRVARLMQQVLMDAPRVGPDGLTPQEQLERILDFTHEFVDEQYRILNDVLIPRLADEQICFVRRTSWTERQAAWVTEYFRAEVLPVLSPLGLDPAHPFPRILNKSLNFIVSLSGEDAFGRASGIAVVQAPRSLPRLIQMPDDVADGPSDFVFLSSIIHAHVSELFAGMRVKGCYQFRVTRNAELFVDEEEVEDLMIALEDELYGRHYGSAVRLEVADNCPLEVAKYLLRQFEIDERHLYQVNGPVNLNRLMMIPGAVERSDLKFAPFAPTVVHTSERGKSDLFEMIQDGDVLLHHPFESFSTVSDFVRQAAQDPDVLAIKQTVYRTEANSALTDALIEAARAGKEVTAVIELRARFDEERNIEIASRLQEAGAHVVYGVVGYKTHAKMLLVVRREPDGLRRYVHLGTGNYHPRTTKLYTDFGLLTCDEDLGEDVQQMFQQLTGLGQVIELKKAFQAPFSLHPHIIAKIEREAENARSGRAARIMAKMNSLTEPRVIRALFRASIAGVQIDLIVRGICRLRPGIPGVSENIRVRSIVGRFLEHTRAFYFYNDGEEDVYCASADWMTRNLVRRVEAAFPIEDAELKRRVMHEAFEVYLSDNTRAWELNPDATFTRVQARIEDPKVNAQETLLRELAEK